MTALRIANCSGFWGDRATAAAEMVRGGPIDVLTGDYLAELSLAILQRQRARGGPGFVGTFLEQMVEVLAECVRRGIKIVSNAGGLDPHGLAAALAALAAEQGVHPRIAVVEGDDLLPRLAELRAAGERFVHLDKQVPLDGIEPLTANAYLGGWGIADALGRGADIVITGRVTDAALVVGPAAWRFGWRRDDWDRLAGAVAAGHIIECSAQATGGNYSFFEDVDWSRPLGFPIAELFDDGSFVITKHPGTGGRVDVGTVTAQLLYEIDGPRYANPDVVARFDTIGLVDEGGDRVRGSGTRGEPPPPALKVAINHAGGFKNAMTVRVAGLDVDRKLSLVEALIAEASGGREPFAEWHAAVRRPPPPGPDGPTDNEGAIADLTITVKSPDRARVGKAWASRVVGLSLSSVPGHSITHPPEDATPYLVFWPALVDAARVSAAVVLDGERTPVAPPPRTAPLERIGDRALDLAEAAALVGVDAGLLGGPTVRAPLGRLLGARSGDKGGNANLGLWARSDAAFAWAAATLTADRLRTLLPDLAPFPLERTLLPNLRAVCFVIRGLLGDGVAASTRSDPQAKTLGEYVRARVVDVPAALLRWSDAASRSEESLIESLASREELHADNRRRWDAAAATWADKEDARALWPMAHRESGRVLLPLELEILGDLRGKRACVLGSGDNLVVFALAGLGARVTSVDISQAQLDVAAERARQSGLAIDFVRADVCELGLPDATFDVIYTGGHVAVWVADLARFYAEATRVLREGGLLLVSEYHPFRRLWADDPERLVVENGYFDRGPHTYRCAPHLYDPGPGELVGHEFAWTIADYLHAVTSAGNRLLRFEELGDEPEGWEGAPMRGLPQHLVIAARKERAAPAL